MNVWVDFKYERSEEGNDSPDFIAAQLHDQ